ncbi:MAG: hypothetical protein U1F76_18465 [Candidatus Competibacteraceae bacterium]
MSPGLFKELLRRPQGFSALLVLALLYVGALFAPFLAPYRPADQSLDNSFHPPTRLFWQDGRVRVRIYQNVDLAAATYQPLPDQSFPLKFFAKGYPYHLLGLIPMERHLFLPDTSDPIARVYLLGSDSTGRDVFSRLLYGSQVSLSIGLIGIAITLTR